MAILSTRSIVWMGAPFIFYSLYDLWTKYPEVAKKYEGKPMNFWDRPLTTIESFAIIVAIVLLSIVLIWRARQTSRRIAKEFLEQYPDAAVLYLYVQDVPNNDGTVVCKRGTASKVFDAKDAPAFGVPHGAACYLIPGYVELDATASWTKDYYLIKRRHQIQAHFSLEAEPGGGYAAVFDQKGQSSKIIKLKKKGGY